MIARELVTRLSFVFDRSNLDKFERSIIGFKTKFSLIAFAVQQAVSKTLDYFDSIASAVRQTKNLADETGIATENFVALRRAAEEFRFKPDQFDAAFSRLAELLRNGKRGVGELFDIQGRSNRKLNLIQFANSGDVRGAFNEIIKYLGSIENLNDRLAATQDILKINRDAAHGVNQIVMDGIDIFNKAAEANSAYGDSFVAQIPKTKEYETNILKFYQALDNATLFLVKNVLPYLTQFVDNVVKSFETLGRIKDVFTLSGVKEGVSALDKQIAQGIKGVLGLDEGSLIKKKAEEENSDFYRKVSEYVSEKSAITITNALTIEVPQGSDEQTAIDISNTTRIALQQFNDNIVRQILSNNPQVE